MKVAFPVLSVSWNCRKYNSKCPKWIDLIRTSPNLIVPITDRPIIFSFGWKNSWIIKVFFWNLCDFLDFFLWYFEKTKHWSDWLEIWYTFLNMSYVFHYANGYDKSQSKVCQSKYLLIRPRIKIKRICCMVDFIGTLHSRLLLNQHPFYKLHFKFVRK